MPPRPRPIWRPRARSVPVPVPDQAHDTNINTNIHIHILPRAPTPKFDNTSISISPPSASPSPPTSIDSDTSTTPAQTSSLWSSTYNSGTGAIIAGIIDSGLVLILIVFLGVVYIQWKRRTGAVPTPSERNPKPEGGNQQQQQQQQQDGGVLVQVDSYGNEKERIGTPTLVARSGSRSGTGSLADNENMRRSDIEEGLLGLTVPGQKKGEEMNEKAGEVQKA